MTDQRELFQLRNGRTVLDESASEKLYTLKELHPEEKDETSTGFEWSDMGMAELFGELYQNEARYCTEYKSWYTYHEGAWRKDIGALRTSEKVKDFVRIMLLYCGEILDDERRKAYATFVNRMGDQRMRTRIIKDAQGKMEISANTFDSDPYLINCLNGTYDLRDFTFREHNWADFLTMQTNFSHTVDRDVTCPRWIQFIDEVCQGDKEKADYLQRALGYSIIGKSNEACMFILWGKTTRNGKSTMLGAIERMLGDYSKVAPVALICREGKQKDADTASPTLAALKGKRFVTMAESNEYGKLDEEKIKQITGGEEISARPLYSEPITYLPQFTLWLSCNDLPAVRDKSIFASERLRVIEFSKHFSQSEQDKNLSEHFDTPEARKGIFMWLIRGYIRYKDRGLTMPVHMQKVLRQYEKDNDIVLQFLEECCEKGESLKIKPKELYDRYKRWSAGEGYKTPMTKQKFYENVEKHPDWTDGRANIGGYEVFRGFGIKSAI